MISNFSKSDVQNVSDFLQDYLKRHQINVLTADECAELLAENGILSNKVGPQPGFNFRQMLRDGRDGLIPMVKGASQERPNTRWSICRI